PPGRALENQAGAALTGQDSVRRVVPAELLGTLVVLQQVEGGEGGQVEAAMVDERRLETAVGDEEAAVELRQALPVHRATLPLRPLDRHVLQPPFEECAVGGIHLE